MSQFLTLNQSHFEIPREQSFNQFGYPIYSRIMCCPWCGQMWARVANPARPVWTFVAVSCDTCDVPTDLAAVPGSVLDDGVSCPGGVDLELVDFLPPELVRREFELTLKAVAHGR